MKRCIYLPLVLLCVALVTPRASAEPAWGSNCLSCHGPVADEYFVRDRRGYHLPIRTRARPARLIAARCRFSRPFEGKPSPCKQSWSDSTWDDTYAVELKRLRYSGVEEALQLKYTGDCAWPEWGENSRYYSDPFISHRWGSGPTTFSFDIDIELDAGFDYYDLVFAVAGKRVSDGELFYAEEHFYLQVQFGTGDLNCDGTIDANDIDAFVLALINPAGYATTYPGCDINRADCNGDSNIDGLDIDPFVALLTGS